MSDYEDKIREEAKLFVKHTESLAAIRKSLDDVSAAYEAKVGELNSTSHNLSCTVGKSIRERNILIESTLVSIRYADNNKTTVKVLSLL